MKLIITTIVIAGVIFASLTGLALANFKSDKNAVVKPAISILTAEDGLRVSILERSRAQAKADQRLAVSKKGKS